MIILIVVIYDLSTGYVFVTRDNVGVLLDSVGECILVIVRYDLSTGYVFVTRDNVGVVLEGVWD